MKFTSSQPSRAHYNPTIIYFTSASKNVTQFVKVLLVKPSDMLHSSNFVRLFHRKSFTLYGNMYMHPQRANIPLQVLDRHPQRANIPLQVLDRHPQRANIPLQVLDRHALTVGVISDPHSQIRALLWCHFTSHGFTWLAKSRPVDNSQWRQ